MLSDGCGVVLSCAELDWVVAMHYLGQYIECVAAAT